MSDLNNAITALTTANTTAKVLVHNHIQILFNNTLSKLAEDGFPYHDALDLATQHVLTLQFLLLGKLEGESKIDDMLLNLTRNDDFAE